MEAREKVLEIIEKDFRISGSDKIFVVLLQIGLIVIKMVVWRPRGYTLVAHNYEAPTEDGAEIFNVTSYHDSCWRYDGFSFLNKFPREDVKNLEIISTEILDFQECFMDKSEKFFIIIKKQ